MTHRRVFIVGTDTGVGKTAVTCALLRTSPSHRLRTVAYKPAQSGTDRPTDAQRLLDATPEHLGLDAADIVAHHYEPPLAPGIAHSRDDFLRPTTPNLRLLRGAVDQLDALERATYPDLILIEGAGGIHVPMPGGTWQLRWIQAMSDRTVVVGRLGLGTINHTILSIDTLMRDGLEPVGFVLVDTDGVAGRDASTADNPAVICAATGRPCLGVMPHAPPGAAPDDGWVERRLFDALLAP